MKAILIFLLLPVFCVNAQSPFDRKIADAAKKLSCAEPDEQSPVNLNAALIDEKDSVAIIVKVRMAPGWHIYGFVPSNLPYIAIDHILELPENLRAVGAWVKSKASSSADDPGVLIYENEALFMHKAVKAPGDKKEITIRTGLYYQTCNLQQCLPPVEKIFELSWPAKMPLP